MTKEQFLGYLYLLEEQFVDDYEDLLDDARRADTPIEYYNKKNQALGVLNCLKVIRSDIDLVDEIYDNTLLD